MESDKGLEPSNPNRIYGSWPVFCDEEINAVTTVLHSGKVNYWTGNEGRAFESEFAEAMGCRYGIALANGTVALELALYALGVREGDEVIVTPRTFIASAGAAVVRGVRPVFADVDLDSGNIDADFLEAAITPRTRAIIAVHLAGWPCDMDSILSVAERHGLYVIEDCAQCHGATYKGKPCGTLGDVAAWSFCQDKIMTTGGEGGMLTTNREDVWEHAWSYKDHGKNYDAVYNQAHPLGFRWLHSDFGTNWRMTEMQAAIGRVQLRKLPRWISTRRRNAEILANRFSMFPALRVPVPADEYGHAHYKFYSYVRPDMLKSDWNRDRIMAECVQLGVPCFSGICGEIYREAAFAKHGLRPEQDLPRARELAETSLMFLVHPTLSVDQMHGMADVVENVIHRATPSGGTKSSQSE